MSASEIDRELLAPLLGASEAECVTLLLGAGASVTSGLPTWNRFAADLLINSGALDSLALAEHLVSRQDPLLVAEAAKAAAGDAWASVLATTLYPPGVEPGYSPLHLAAAAYRTVVGAGRARLATLNFDILLESALLDAAPDDAVVSVTDSAEVTPSDLEVHHLHGLILEPSLFDEFHEDEVVLTLTDYTGVLETEAPWQLEYLQNATRDGAVVIAGTSYRDPDLRQWLHLALKGCRTHHPAVVLLAREAFELDKSSWAAARGALTGQWTAVGLTPVLLHDHVDAAQVIREIPYMGRPGYETPRDRVRKLWSSHEQGFAALQSHYSEILDRQATRARDVLSARAVNATLWLADGDGHVVQYASHDRVFHRAPDLRRVPVGHDSPWIAALALGREQVVAEDLAQGRRETGRWNAVLAAPVTLTPEAMPFFASACLSIGLPDNLAAYDAETWTDLIADLAAEWGRVLTAHFCRQATADEGAGATKLPVTEEAT